MSRVQGIRRSPSRKDDRCDGDHADGMTPPPLIAAGPNGLG
jgi:hypothetical protein